MRSRFAIVFVIAVAAAWGQRGGGGAPGAGGASTGGGVMSPTPGMNSRSSNPNSLPSVEGPGITTPIFLSGKVVMADGSALPPGIEIQRVCQGAPRTVAYTDSHGGFSFQWGDYAGITPDASEPGSNGLGGSNRGISAATAGGSSVTNMTSTAPVPRSGIGNSIGACELRANLPGFTSDRVNLFMHRAMDSPDVGRIVLHRNAAVEGTSVSATSLSAPKDAKKAYEKGMQALQKGKQEEAGKEFEKAVTAYPRYADAWVALGRVRLASQATAPAREAFTSAINSDSKLVIPYVELGMMAAHDQNWRDSADYLDKAVKLDPVDFPQAWYVDAVANFNLKKLEPAEKSAREAVKLDPQHKNPRVDYLLGLVLIEKRDYAGAAAELKSYLAMSPAAENQEEVRKQLEQIEKMQPESSTESVQPKPPQP